MKKLQSIIALILCVVLLCSCADKQDPTQTTVGTNPSTTPSGELTYRVTVVDANGAGVSAGVIVNFKNGDQLAAMQTVNDQGVAEKVLVAGTYTVELGFTDASVSHHYDTSDLTLTADRTSLTIVLSQALSEESQTLSAYSDAAGEHRDYTAYHISAGSTYVPLDTADRTYLLFTPTEPGLYEFSVPGSTAQIGYHGAPHFVQPNNLAEMTEEGTFTMNVSAGMIGDSSSGTTVLVIGIDSNGNTDCIVSIQRIGDPELTIEDIPWDVYEATVALNPYVLPENMVITDFDLKAASDAYKLVLNSSDGFYHLGSADGPLVYAKLGVSSGYLDSIETVLENSGIARYFFDENGEFLSKESYTECLMQYIANMDAVSGLYPLTEDLVYIFQQRGEYVGWWKHDSETYLFVDENGNHIPGINTDIAWLFLCCYGELSGEPVAPCTDGHTEVTDAAKSASCTSEGLTEGKHCSVCGTVTVAQQKVPATGHSYGAWVEVKAPTTESTGTAERTCPDCGGKEQKTLEKLKPEDPCSKGHTLVTDTAKAATCTKTGLTEGQHCSVCGAVTKQQQVIPASGHSYSEWKQVKAPTLNETGLAERTCATCGNKEQKTLDKLEKTVGTPANEEPIELGGAGALNFTAEVNPGQYVNYSLYKVNDTYLTIHSDYVYVIYNGDVYWPVNGVVSVFITSDSPNVPMDVGIGNFSSETLTFTVQCVYPEGSMMNPAALPLGNFEANLPEGTQQGYYYTFIADRAGTLTLSFEGITNGVVGGITLYNFNTYEQVSLQSDADVNTVSIHVNAGDEVQIIISVIPNAKHEYPAATIKLKAIFE